MFFLCFLQQGQNYMPEFLHHHLRETVSWETGETIRDQCFQLGIPSVAYTRWKGLRELCESLEIKNIDWSELDEERQFCVNPLSPDINMHILLSVLHTFLMVLGGRICTNIKTFHGWWSLPFVLVTCMLDQVGILWGKIRCLSLLARGLTKQSKIVYHDKSYSFETDFDWLIRFNGKKRNIWNRISFCIKGLRLAQSQSELSFKTGFKDTSWNFILQNTEKQQHQWKYCTVAFVLHLRILIHIFHFLSKKVINICV